MLGVSIHSHLLLDRLAEDSHSSAVAVVIEVAAEEVNGAEGRWRRVGAPDDAAAASWPAGYWSKSAAALFVKR